MGERHTQLFEGMGGINLIVPGSGLSGGGHSSTKRA